MLSFTADMFKASNDHWKSLYANGLAWCPSGIESLAYEGVNPHHVALPLQERNDEKRKVVYAIYDHSNEIVDDNDNLVPNYCFFEDDYKECFKLFRSLQTTSSTKQHIKNATLSVGFLTLKQVSDQPLNVWKYNSDYLFEHHGNCKNWSDTLKSWMV